MAVQFFGETVFAHIDFISKSEDILHIFESLVGLLAIAGYSFYGVEATPLKRQTAVVTRAVTTTMDRVTHLIGNLSSPAGDEIKEQIHASLGYIPTLVFTERLTR